jgi:DNA replication protein DnaC
VTGGDDLVEKVGGLLVEGQIAQLVNQILSSTFIDEIGYLALDPFGAAGLFQQVGERYEHGSMILTSNKSYGDWGSIFQDNVIASAILDRPLHPATTINIKGESYRLKDQRKAGVLSKAAATPAS